MKMLFEWLTAEFSTPLNAVAQIVGIFPLVLSFFTFLFNDRRRVIVIKAVSDLMWAIHFFLLGEVVGGSINTLNTARNLVFSQKHKPWASRPYIPVLFCILTFLAALIRWREWYSFLPMLGSVFAVIGFWCSDVKNIRKFNLPAVSLWLIYGIMTGSISTILCNTFSILSIIIATVKQRKYDAKETENEIVATK